MAVSQKKKPKSQTKYDTNKRMNVFSIFLAGFAHVYNYFVIEHEYSFYTYLNF